MITVAERLKIIRRSHLARREIRGDRMRYRSMMRASVAGAIALLPVVPAFAQTGELVLEEIVVTAQRAESSLQRTPVAVTAVSAEALTEKGATSMLDLGSFTPNLTVGSRSTAGTTQGGFTIRGMGVDSTGSSPAVGIYIDEVYYPSGSANLLGFFDVSRVEVLRGPQGTLFGRNTIAGAVQYVSAKPDDQAGGYVTGTVGTHGKREVGTALNAPLAETLSARLSARYNELGGFVEDELQGFERGGEKTKQARLQLRWTPAETVSVDLKGEILNQTGNGRGLAILGVSPGAQFVGLATAPAQFLPPAIVALRPIAETRPLDNRYVSTKKYSFAGFDAPDGMDFNFRTGQGAITWDATDSITLKSISAYSFSQSDTPVDVDNTPLAILRAERGVVTTKLFTQEMQAIGRSFEDQLNWTFGLYYYDSQETTRGQFTFFGPAGIASPQNGGDTRIDITSLAAYGQASYSLTDALSLAVGLRYSEEKFTGAYLNTIVPGVFVPPFGVSPVTLPVPAFSNPEKEDFSNLSPHIGLNYQSDSDTMFYIKASRGFRAGGFAVSNQLQPSGFLAYDPETAWSYEAGARLQWLDDRLRFNPTIFQTNWDDIQFNAFVAGPGGIVPVTRNAGDARIRGVELETQFVATDRLLLNGSASYLRSKYTRVAPGIDVRLDSDLQQSPEWKFAVGGRYNQPLDGGAELVASLDYAWTDRRRSAVSEADAINLPSYGMLNARLQYTPPSGAWTLALYGTNLTNEYYYIGGINGAVSTGASGAVNLGTFGTKEGDLGRPREAGVNLRINF